MNTNNDVSRQTDKIKQRIEQAKKVKSEELAKAILYKAFSLRKTILLAAMAVSLSACFGKVQVPTDNGRILIDADAKGLQAFFDGQNGLITNGKASPDIDTAHWRTRREQEEEVTKREYAPSFLQKIFGTEQPSQTVAQESARPSQANKIEGVTR